jgi:23S rRNA (guanosine2251-2'-O)-methyltransferase
VLANPSNDSHRQGRRRTRNSSSSSTWQAKVPLRYEPREALDRASHEAATRQGILAFTTGQRYAQFAEIPAKAQLLVLLDGVEDPHNLGAIIRSAHAAWRRRRPARSPRPPRSPKYAAKAAAGALAHLPIVRIGNVAQTLEKTEAAGLRIYGCTEHGAEIYHQVVGHLPTVLVVGAEGAGRHDPRPNTATSSTRCTAKSARCNVSVATCIALFEWRRRAATAR